MSQVEEVEIVFEDEDDMLFDVVEDDGPDNEGDRLVFADPGGRSALRAASRDNPRDQPCPTCGRGCVLTMEDVHLGYQCDACADAAEGRNW